MFYTNVTQISNKILHRYIDDDGKKQSELIDFSPSLYVPDKNGNYSGINGEKLSKKSFNNIYNAREYIKEYEKILEIHGNTNYWAQFIQEEYGGEVNFDLDKLTIANIDIETLINDPANPGLNPLDNPIDAVNAITLITVECKKKYYVFGYGDFTGECDEDGLFILRDENNKISHRFKAKFIGADNEVQMLDNFLKFWNVLNPDIITGWHINGFDIPYMIGRIANKLGEDHIHRLSPEALKYNERTISVREHKNGNGHDISFDGINIIDYYEAYKKFTYKTREKYSLDHIAFVELNENKLDYSEYGNLDDLHNKNYNKYVIYNIRDTDLVRKLDLKINLMQLIMTLTYMCHIRHEDVFSQVRMWDTLIYNYLLDSNIIIPPKKSYEKTETYEGAYVRETKVGLHDWIISFDLNSLYPHLIMQYGISPEMKVNRNTNDLLFGIEDLINKNVDLSFLKDEDLSMTANKVFFKRDKKGFLSEIMDSLYNQRSVVKKQMLKNESTIELINSILESR